MRNNFFGMNSKEFFYSFNFSLYFLPKIDTLRYIILNSYPKIDY
ncbi:hypothetical protein MmTuc01_2220 [Methanosarcina mazei Tuc01]|uniref:Uncharacterized protein n=1 Tax=Methanosarcina mazei Tuc01 TaxID=1236903 RepID=M1PYX4_METMZ|nr:hypothetical protein MmTuc01_2220 [Methanosarcina mazei Tuc01]